MVTEGDIPDDEIADMQREEVHALEAIFEGALDLQSPRQEDNFGFPIVYRMNLNEMDVDAENCSSSTTNWPNKPLVVEIRYPKNYPSDEHDLATTVPDFQLRHDNTVLEFPSRMSEKLLEVLRETAQNERGMPSVLSCLYAARDFLDGDREWEEATESKSSKDNLNTEKLSSDNTAIVPPSDIKYACISTHHLLDHKPDNLLKTGHKSGLKGFYKFGTPGIAIAWGDQNKIDDFCDILKRAMPQKKFELVFCRSWSVELPEGWQCVDPQGLRKELAAMGVPEEDYYTALGLEKSHGKPEGKSIGKGGKTKK